MRKVIKTLFRYLPFKKQLFGILKLIYTPSKSIHKHLYFKGPFYAKVRNRKMKLMHYGYELENEIFWRGLNGYEKITIDLWLNLSENSGVIFDVGANTGLFSLLAKTINSATTVYAFEPVERIFKKLKYNNELNGFDIRCIPEALSNHSGTATIYDTLEEHLYSVTVNKNRNPTDVRVRETVIKTISLDDFIEQNNIYNIDLIKIDVETHEPEVIEGFKKNLSKMKPSIIVEILSDAIGKAVEDKVKDLGYLFFAIDETHGLKKVEHITLSEGYNYLLCQPEVANTLQI